jgi:ribulose kinase
LTLRASLPTLLASSLAPATFKPDAFCAIAGTSTVVAAVATAIVATRGIDGQTKSRIAAAF